MLFLDMLNLEIAVFTHYRNDIEANRNVNLK